jgi:hypothetical protein
VHGSQIEAADKLWDSAERVGLNMTENICAKVCARDGLDVFPPEDKQGLQDIMVTSCYCGFGLLVMIGMLVL